MVIYVQEAQVRCNTFSTAELLRTARKAVHSVQTHSSPQVSLARETTSYPGSRSCLEDKQRDPETVFQVNTFSMHAVCSLPEGVCGAYKRGAYQRSLPEELTRGAYQRSLPEELTRGAYERSLAEESRRDAYQRSLPEELTRGAYERSLAEESRRDAYRRSLAEMLTRGCLWRGIAAALRRPPPSPSGGGHPARCCRGPSGREGAHLL